MYLDSFEGTFERTVIGVCFTFNEKHDLWIYNNICQFHDNINLFKRSECEQSRRSEHFSDFLENLKNGNIFFRISFIFSCKM